MRRLILLILALLLMFDLGEDGGLGKATFVVPPSDARTSHTSPLKDCSGNVDPLYTLPSQDVEMSPQMQLQSVTVLAQPAPKRVIATHTGSSGGIPL